MTAKKKQRNDISTLLTTLSEKMKILQNKVDDLCESTGGCARVKKVNNDLRARKDDK